MTKEGPLASPTLLLSLLSWRPSGGPGLGLPLLSASPSPRWTALGSTETPQAPRPYMVTESQAGELEGTLEDHLALQPSPLSESWMPLTL